MTSLHYDSSGRVTTDLSRYSGEITQNQRMPIVSLNDLVTVEQLPWQTIEPLLVRRLTSPEVHELERETPREEQQRLATINQCQRLEKEAQNMLHSKVVYEIPNSPVLRRILGHAKNENNPYLVFFQRNLDRIFPQSIIGSDEFAQQFVEACGLYKPIQAVYQKTIPHAFKANISSQALFVWRTCMLENCFVTMQRQTSFQQDTIAFRVLTEQIYSNRIRFDTEKDTRQFPQEDYDLTYELYRKATQQAIKTIAHDVLKTALPSFLNSIPLEVARHERNIDIGGTGFFSQYIEKDWENLFNEWQRGWFQDFAARIIEPKNPKHK